MLVTSIIIVALSSTIYKYFIYGPKKFQRDKAKPEISNNYFNVANQSLIYKLIIFNGDGIKSDMVTSAIIAINNIPIFSQNDFNRNTIYLEKDVKLLSKNTISVKINGKPNSYISLKITAILNDESVLVNSQGGEFAFSNGIILNIPPDAVENETIIEISDIDCNDVNVVLNQTNFRPYKRRCIGGFSGKPDGLIFKKPVSAIVPVKQLMPFEIPLLIKKDLSSSLNNISDTDLIYNGLANNVEIRNINHFSEFNFIGYLLSEYYNWQDERCKNCPAGSLVSCELLDPKQPACCLLIPSEREICASNCDCCREKLIIVKCSELDFSSGECQILSSRVTVEFPDCEGPSETYSISEIGSECPQNMTYEINITPPQEPFMVGEQEQLAATITGKSADGQLIIQPTEFYPIWDSSNRGIVDVNSDGLIRGIGVGSALIIASGSEGSDIARKEISVNVTINCNEIIEPAYGENWTGITALDPSTGIRTLIASHPGAIDIDGLDSVCDNNGTIHVVYTLEGAVSCHWNMVCL